MQYYANKFSRSQAIHDNANNDQEFERRMAEEVKPEICPQCGEAFIPEEGIGGEPLYGKYCSRNCLGYAIVDHST